MPGRTVFGIAAARTPEWKLRHPAWLLLSSFLFLAACGGSSESSPGGGSGGTAGGDGSGGSGGSVPPVEVAWGTCPFGSGECTTLEVPLDWAHPGESQTIPFAVRRYRTSAAERKGQLWLLEGGPGEAGWGYTQQVDVFRALAPGYDLYIPDYRGVGYSAWLGCDYQEGGEFTRACMNKILDKWGDGLGFFTTTDAVRDIGYAIDATRAPGDRVYLYGVSYGTFVLNRFLTVFPDKADAAVLDSVCPSTGCDVKMDMNFNRVAKFVFDSCGGDPFCQSKLGADPWATFASVAASLQAGHCSAFLGYPSNRTVLEQLTLLSVADPHAVPMALAMLYRMERCNAADVAALQSLLDWFSSPGGFAIDADTSSRYLSLHVVFSEFWPDGYDRAAAEAELAQLPLHMGTVASWLDDKDVWTWPASVTPPDLYRWAPTVSETPMLFLNGTLDGQTFVDGVRPVKDTFRNARQQYVEVPLAGHSVLYTSQAISRTKTCGMDLVAKFFGNPAAPVDTSCVGAIGGLDFRGSSAMAFELFGTSDMWENPAASALALPAPLSPAETRALETLRRNLQHPPRF